MFKSILSLFLIVYLSSNALAQVGCPEYPYNGNYKCVWGTGYTGKEGRMVNGEQHGEWKSYFHTGELSAIFTYNMGEADGVWKSWNSDGFLEYDQIWDNGEKISDKQYDENGRLESWEKWDNQGRKQGDHTYYSIDGRVSRVTTYLDDEWLIRKEYHPNGNLANEERSLPDYKAWVQNFDEDGTLRSEGMTDVVGVPDGDWKIYNENGRLESEGRYFKSKFDGDWKFYYPDGKLLRTASFNGVRAYNYGGNFITGDFKEFYNSGQLAVHKLYNEEGLQDGEALVYYENGNIFERADFEQGRIMEFQQYKPDGQPYDNDTFQNGSGTIKVYNIQGELAQEGVMENGVPKQ